MRSRLYVVLALAVLWFAALGARLYHLQVVEHDHYVERARGQQRYVLVSTPPRGTIFDSRGRELAISVEAASAFANPREIADPVEAARPIAEALGCDREKLAERLSRDDTRFVWIGRQLGPEPVHCPTAFSASHHSWRRPVQLRHLLPPDHPGFAIRLRGKTPDLQR